MGDLIKRNERSNSGNDFCKIKKDGTLFTNNKVFAETLNYLLGYVLAKIKKFELSGNLISKKIYQDLSTKLEKFAVFPSSEIDKVRKNLLKTGDKERKAQYSAMIDMKDTFVSKYSSLCKARIDIEIEYMKMLRNKTKSFPDKNILKEVLKHQHKKIQDDIKSSNLNDYLKESYKEILKNLGAIASMSQEEINENKILLNVIRDEGTIVYFKLRNEVFDAISKSYVNFNKYGSQALDKMRFKKMRTEIDKMTGRSLSTRDERIKAIQMKKQADFNKRESSMFNKQINKLKM
jgi:hypothetical protein